MTHSSTNIKISYVGDGSTLVFSYNFRVWDLDALRVLYINSAGAKTVLTKDSHFTIVDNGDETGGNITLINDYAVLQSIGGLLPTASEQIWIIRDTDLTQEILFTNNTVIPADSIEQGLDRANGKIQELDERVDRSITLQETSTTTGLEIDEPVASKVVAWDTTATTLTTTNASIVDIEAWGDAATSYVGGVIQNPLIGPDIFTGDGSTTGFTLSYDVSGYENSVLITVDGTKLRTAEYTITGTSLLITSGAPANLAKIEVLYIGALAVDAALADSAATSAQEWATLITGQVESTDYSSKAYAIGGTGITGSIGAAKEWAVTTGSTIDGADYSSKEYAIGTTIAAGSSKDWATITGGFVDGSDYSSKEYAIGTTLATGSAKGWASTMAGTVDGSDYSAKEHAIGAVVPTGSSKDWAIETSDYVIGTENSSESWAIGGTGNGDPSAGSAKKWAMHTEDVLVDGVSYSAYHYAQKAAGSAGAIDGKTILDTSGDTKVETERAGDTDKVWIRADGTDVGEFGATQITLTPDVVISGNLTVTGTQTIIDTVNYTVADPLFVIARNQSTGLVDTGIIFNRGVTGNVAFIWDESEDHFCLSYTPEDGTTVGNITKTSYAALNTGELTVDGIISNSRLQIDQNVISTLNTNENIELAPAGTGAIEVQGNIRANVDNVYTIGTASYKFNEVHATTFYGTSTSAQYADTAERYESDEALDEGDVVEIGGIAEVTKSKNELSTTVFGVMSVNPAYAMNSAAGNDNTHPYIALAGRVPVKVVGKVNKGDRLVTSNVSGVARAIPHTEVIANHVVYMAVIGRALESKVYDDIGLVDTAVMGVR